jgi:hypothetical protein
MSGLPREILKWMQSLDLSYSVKNVKRCVQQPFALHQHQTQMPEGSLNSVVAFCRLTTFVCSPLRVLFPLSDFANGFLVAEILSRYHKGDTIVSLHSFDNGLGLVRRVQNWALLEKAFKKLGFPIERNLIDQVIHCKKDAAIPLMEQLYTLLTHKTVQSVRPAVRDESNVPAFARPTASLLIKERMFEADLAHEDRLDQTLAPAKAAQVLAKHMHNLKMERETDPARFQPKQTGAAAAAAAGATMNRSRKSGASGSGEVTSFKEVQVRQVDDKGGVLQLRAQHVYGQQLSPTRQSGPNSDAHAFESSLASTGASAAAAAAPLSPSSRVPGQGALQLLSSALLSALGPESGEGAHLLSVCSASSPPCEPITAWCSGSDASGGGGAEALRLPDDHLAHIIGNVLASPPTSAALAELSLANPKEFWQVSSVLFALLDRLQPATQSFSALLALLSNLGLRMVSRDPAATSALFFDFALAKWLGVMRSPTGGHRKIFQTARLAYAFVGDTPAEHGKLIRAVHEALVGSDAAANEEGRRLFYAHVAALAPFEGNLLVADEYALLKSYLKLLEAGLATGSARTRATALSILAPLAANHAFDERIMRRLMDTMRGLMPEAASSAGRVRGHVERAEQDADSAAAAAAAAEPSAEDGVGADEISAVSSPRRSVRARSLAGDEWLLDAELLHCISCALSQPSVLDPSSSSAADMQAELNGWAEALLTADGVPFPTLRAGLAHLTHVLHSQPPLRRVWVRLLLDDDALRARVLAPDAYAAAAATAAAPSESGESAAAAAAAPGEDDPSPELSESFCPALRSVWHPLMVCKSVADEVRVAGLENLTEGHLDLLAAATEDAFGVQEDERTANAASVAGPVIGAGAFPDSESVGWNALFSSLRDHLVVELCDPSLCESVAAVIKRFLLDARTTHTAQAIFLPVALSEEQQQQQQQGDSATAAQSSAAALPPLYWLMRFMFPSADGGAQLGLAGWLDDLSRRGHLAPLVHRVLLVFADTEAEKFQSSTLGPLLNKLNQQAAQAGAAQQ